MDKNSNTLIEIFNERYPDKAVLDNPLIGAEALGFIKCLEMFMPSISEEFKRKKLEIYLSIAIKM